MSTIRLITGGIGAAKTLWVMEQLYNLKNNHPDRKVYTDITGIKHTGVESVKEDFDWRDAENNSLIIFDEVQYKDLFSRHNSKRDKQILDLTTIRKRGIELWLITQRARFLNPDVLGLVNEHVHLEKTGMKTAKVYIWHEAKTAMTKTDKLLPFEKYVWQHPEHLYGFYESIQPDAKHHKRSYFNKGIVPVVLTLVLAAIPAYYVIKNGWGTQIGGTSSNEVKADQSKTDNASNNSIDLRDEKNQNAYADQNKKITDCMTSFGWSHDQCREALDPEYLKANNDAMLAKTNNSMEAITVKYNPAKPYDTRIEPDYQVTAKPLFSGCIKYGNRYVAYTQQGTRLDVDASVCKRLINEGDRPFNYFANSSNSSTGIAGATAVQNSNVNSTASSDIRLTPAEQEIYLEILRQKRQSL
ncbi:zonular occludens toxin domain-containing protein [Acinetobacter colistiniresistens]|uniref:zonular occludens toxin domain-containing protein n=1 Tax=Acinetobacter colistiniresistens TaxID=280145 RepID=UPI000BDEBC5E|nr:zonular occludens toxin domain-containing protein [Acinetobacter colistiniresistens]